MPTPSFTDDAHTMQPGADLQGSVLGYDTIWNGRLRTARLESTWQPSNLFVVPNLLCAPSTGLEEEGWLFLYYIQTTFQPPNHDDHYHHHYYNL